MCGRFSLTGDLDFYVSYFGVHRVAADRLEPSWNLAPTDRVYAVVEEEGRRVLQTMRWGLTPHQADQSRVHINCRIETVATSPPFRDSFALRRCLIPADGFYEWEPPESGGSPHHFYRADGHPMVFAGIWNRRKMPGTGEPRLSCSILTMGATGAVAGIHHRMPVILPEESWPGWLGLEITDPEAALSMVRTIDPELIMEHRVSSRVNSVRNNGPELHRPAERETLF